MSKALLEYIAFDKYRAAPGLNLSLIKLMAQSALAFKHRRDNPNTGKATQDLDVGRGCHTATLEPDAWANEVCVYPGKVRRGKEWDKFQVANKDKQIMTSSEYWICGQVAAAVHRHPWASQYFDQGEPEVSIFWEHPIGFQCKSRIDWLRDDAVIDLKTARDVTERGFARAAASLSYHAQCAFYLDAAKALDGRERKMILIAVEKEQPFDVVCYRVPDEAIAAGRRLYQDWMLKVKACEASGVWPGVDGGQGEVELQLPQWAFDEMDDAKLIIDGVEVAV